MEYLLRGRGVRRKRNLARAGGRARAALRLGVEPLEHRLMLFATGGDFNGDGIVAAPDLILVRLNWGVETDEPIDGWVGMPHDGRVDQNELDAVLLNWLQIVDPSPQSAAPLEGPELSANAPPAAAAALGSDELYDPCLPDLGHGETLEVVPQSAPTPRDVWFSSLVDETWARPASLPDHGLDQRGESLAALAPAKESGPADESQGSRRLPPDSVEMDLLEPGRAERWISERDHAVVEWALGGGTWRGLV